MFIQRCEIDISYPPTVAPNLLGHRNQYRAKSATTHWGQRINRLIRIPLPCSSVTTEKVLNYEGLRGNKGWPWITQSYLELISLLRFVTLGLLGRTITIHSGTSMTYMPSTLLQRTSFHIYLTLAMLTPFTNVFRSNSGTYSIRFNEQIFYLSLLILLSPYLTFML